jgi:hypothetical protein
VVAKGIAYREQRDRLERWSTPVLLSRFAIAGERVWVAEGSTLFAYRDATWMRAREDVPPEAVVLGADGGDVWLAAPHARTTRRFSFLDRSATWRSVVKPVFDRVCAHCHRVDGDADLDLSTASQWIANAARIEPALESGHMPPTEQPISDGEREALLRWVTSR